MSHSELTSSLANEYNVKDQLYSIFDQLSHEIKGEKIDIDEDELKENLPNTSIEQILNYIRNSLRIILTKEKQKEKTPPLIPKDNTILQYEYMLKSLEGQKRLLLRNEFHYKMQKEAMENKLNELLEVEQEYSEMKTKLKYEDRKLLDNDQKENEIVILREENTNLKNIIAQNELKRNNYTITIEDKNKQIEELKEKNTLLINKIKKIEKELNLVSNININIHNANNGENSNSNTIINHPTSKYSFWVYNNGSEIKNAMHSQNKFLNLKELKKQVFKNLHDNNYLSEKHGNYSNKLNYQRNNSMNLLLDKKKYELVSKYFSKRIKKQAKCSSLTINGKKKKTKNGPLSISQSSLTNRNSSSNSLLKNYNITSSKPNNSTTKNNTSKNIKSNRFCLSNFYQKTPRNRIIKNKVLKGNLIV